MYPVVDPRIVLHKHTRKEFRERMQSGELTGCILPIAATEQHLEHLAMEHDFRSCWLVSCEVARRLSPNVLVAPVMNIGISEHHMRHIGTLTAMPGSFLGMLHDGIRSLHHAGFRNILVLNGHGGNIAPCEGMWGQFLQRFECNLVFKSYWDFLDPQVANRVLKTKRYPGHAQEFETAFALAAFPENVRVEPMLRQEDQEPVVATAEAGRELIESIVSRTTDFMHSMITGKYVAEIPPFHP